jgi:uncharacterized protein (DUF697 family)
MTELALQQEQEQIKRGRLSARLFDRLAKVIDETDEKAAAERVARQKAVYPGATPEELTERLIRHKCRDTAVVGATTSSVALIPGLGTITSFALGVATDFGITFKMQAELVLEIAAVYNHQLSPEEKRRVVLLVTGLSVGATTLAHRAGQGISNRVTTRLASKYVTRALPFVGMAASAGTNAAMTYMIGKRAQAYFSLGPEALADWRATAQAITGLDRQSLASGAKKVGSTAVSATKGITQKAGSLITRRRNKQPEQLTDEIIPVFDK